MVVSCCEKRRPCLTRETQGSGLMRNAIIVASLFAVSFALSAMACRADARARPDATAQAHPVGGRVLGLSAICDECRPERFSSECSGLLEGPVFDREGTLWVAGILKGVIWRVSPDGHCAVGMQLPPEVKFPCGLRFSQDGTLYGVAMGYGLFSVDLSSKKVSLLANGASLGGLPDGAFHGLDDIFIDRTGGMYLTDAAGSSVLNPVGQLFYRDSSGNVKRIISGGLMFPNGVVLSPDEKMLYIDEWAANRILAVPVVSPGVINSAWAYVFATMQGGHGPDSMTADSAGNIYVAHYGSGEVLIFAPNGDYYGPIRLPEDAGSNPTNLAFHNGYLYITESEKGEIWRVKAKIPGIKLYGGS
jgi:gluconolactonase